MKLLALLMIAVTLLSSMFVVAVVIAPPPPTTVYLSPDPVVAGGPGESVIVSIMISGVPTETPIYGLGAVLSWHPPLLQAVSVSEGDFLTKSGSGAFFTKVIDNSELASSITIGWTSLGAVPGESGSGMIATIEFLVEGTGECPLTVTTSLLTINPLPPPDFNEVAHTDISGTFYTTNIYWMGGLVGKSAWPTAHHWSMAARLPDTMNTLFAKVRSQGTMDVWVKVQFTIRTDSGLPITLETEPYLLTVTEGDHTFSVDFDTAANGAGKYFAEAKVKYDTNGDGNLDTWASKIKTFSFAVVP